MTGRLLSFFAGMLVSLVLLAALAFFGGKKLADWMVVSAEPSQADAIVVLGGGDGSRLRKGLELYDQGFAPRLVLVDTRKEDWLHIVRRLCADCELEGKDVTIVEGSTSTRTDAELTLDHCRQNGLQSILIVTSPYHTRRAQRVFADLYGSTDIRTQVISTGDYGHLKSPGAEWWHDERTMQTVWVEFGKILYWELLGAR